MNGQFGFVRGFVVTVWTRSLALTIVQVNIVVLQTDLLRKTFATLGASKPFRLGRAAPTTMGVEEMGNGEYAPAKPAGHLRRVAKLCNKNRTLSDLQDEAGERIMKI